MPSTRRFVIAAGAAAAAAPAWGAPRRKACKGRGTYAGYPLRVQLPDAVFAAAAAAGQARSTFAINDKLEDHFAKLAAGQKVPVAAAVATADGALWNQVIGSGVAAESFLWGDMARAYAATAALQLVEAGKLTLEATIDRWAPEAPNARWITVEDLLAQTSGLAGRPPAAEFCPGASWSWSEANPALLVRILEAVDGRPYAEALTQRIVRRLDLAETKIQAPGTLAASPGDVVRFWRALFAGRLHSDALVRRRFQRLYPMPTTPGASHGLGVMVNDFQVRAPAVPDLWLGHAGGSAVPAALAAWSVKRRVFIAVAYAGAGDAAVTAGKLLAELPQAAR